MVILPSHTTFSDMPWPEPLVIELVSDHLDRHPLTSATRRVLARQHAAALRDMVADRDPSWRSARRDLSARYAELGIAKTSITAIDCLVFFELTHLAADWFRTSPRGVTRPSER